MTKDQKQKDPVCGMSVNAKADLQLDHDHKHYAFCSKQCLDKFKKHPEQYRS